MRNSVFQWVIAWQYFNINLIPDFQEKGLKPLTSEPGTFEPVFVYLYFIRLSYQAALSRRLVGS
jgi:hypothetical protein